MSGSATVMMERPETSALVGPYLIDTIRSDLQLVEAAELTKNPLPKGVIGRFKGKFGEVDRPTNNGRVYGKDVMEREIKRLQEDVQQRGCFGELDHPADGRTKLGRVSHIITQLRLEGNQIYGEADIVNTQAGRDLLAIVEAKGRAGVSSRGIGTTEADMNGNKVVNQDYRLMTFDVVGEPATPGAFPKFFMEGREVDPSKMTSAELRKTFPDLVRELVLEATAQVKADLTEEATQKALVEENSKLKKELEEAKKGVAPVVATGTPSKPALSAEDAKALEEAKKLKEQVSAILTENTSLKKQVNEVASVAQALGYKHRVSEAIRGRHDADKAAKLIGDPTKFETLEELDAKVKQTINALDRENALEESKQAQAKAERKAAKQSQALLEQKKINGTLLTAAEGDAKQRSSEGQRLAVAFDGKIKELREEFEGRLTTTHGENQQLRENLQKAVTLAEELHARVYAEQKIASHPARPAARRLVEATRPKSVPQVDSLLKTLLEATGTNRNNEFESIQRHVSKSRQVVTEADETKRSHGAGPGGSSWHELQVLAGIIPSENGLSTG